MARLTLQSLLGRRREAAPVVAALLDSMGSDIGIEDETGTLILGSRTDANGTKCPVMAGTEILGWVTSASEAQSGALAGLLGHLASLEAEKKNMGGEVLSLYRELNLIHQFSEKLSSLIDVRGVTASALEQARQVLPSTGGAVLLVNPASGALEPAVMSGEPFLPAQGLAASEGLLARLATSGSAEIVNDVRTDPRYRTGDPDVASLLCAPLRVNDQPLGVIFLASLTPVVYAAADLKLLSTLALQTATAIENATLHERNLQTVKAEALQATLLEVEAQKRKAEEMLLNILPESVARELQEFGAVQPMYFEDVTIGFTDFVGFSKSTMLMAAEDVVKELHKYFTAFDRILERYGLEKLKTIGDSYMFASGLPVRRPSNPLDAVLVAMEMVEAVRRMGESGEGANWQIRVGLHTGPVIAGVVGIRKFAFDVWGETVNFASRMESSGEANRINISERTFARVKDFIAVEHRGRLLTKDGAEADMYFVKGVLDSLMTDLATLPPPVFERRYRLYFRDRPQSFPQYLMPAVQGGASAGG